MTPIERYRELYEYEIDCDQKMLASIESVPESNRSDPRFQQAVTIAGHLAACRENWLGKMDGDGLHDVAWFDRECDVATLQPRFVALETAWTDYLARLDDSGLAKDFEFPENGMHFRLPTEVQILQLVCHAPYHRGQICLLVDQLGGETMDSDYVFWKVPESA